MATSRKGKTPAAKRRARLKKTAAAAPAVPRLPSPRGRNSHPLMDEIPGLRDWFEAELLTNPRPTLFMMREKLQATGFWQQLQELGHENGISRGTLSDERIKFELRKTRREMSLIVAKAFNAGEVDILELDTAISGMISIEIQRHLEMEFEADETGFSDKAIELAEAFRKQLAAHTNLERSKMYLNRGATRAEHRILARVLEVLKGADPKSRDILIAAIRDGAAEVRK